ncbi:MAG: hypothetical protein QMC38_10335 [Sinobacterium sp.]
MREMEVALTITLSFLIFSTISSMVLEVFYRYKKIRLKGLQVILKDFYESELLPIMRHKLNNATASSPELVKHVLRLNKDNHILSVSQFIERLATSEITSQISKKSTVEMNILVNDFARRYEEYGVAFSHRFKQFAERDNLILGVAIALLLNVNVNVISLTKTFLDNRGLTESLIAKSEAILESAEAEQERIQKFSIEASDTKDVADFKAAVERLQKTSAGLLCSLSNKKTVPEATQSNQRLDEKIDPLTYAACKSTFDKVLFWGFSSSAWLLSTIMTGLLIGLRGPFWFDVVKRISLTRNILSSISPGKRKTLAENDDVPMHEDYVTLFTNAHIAEKIVKGATAFPNSPKPPAPSNVRLGNIVR